MSNAPSGIARRGFASMSPERRAEISAKGGASKKRDPQTRTFALQKDLASIAGSIGGKKSRRKSLTRTE